MGVIDMLRRAFSTFGHGGETSTTLQTSRELISTAERLADEVEADRLNTEQRLFALEQRADAISASRRREQT